MAVDCKQPTVRFGFREKSNGVSAPDPDRATALPIDALGMEVLADLVASNEWNEYNYTNSAGQDPRYRGNVAALSAIAEALGWLRGRGLIARTPM